MASAKGRGDGRPEVAAGAGIPPAGAGRDVGIATGARSGQRHLRLRAWRRVAGTSPALSSRGGPSLGLASGAVWFSAVASGAGPCSRLKESRWPPSSRAACPPSQPHKGRDLACLQTGRCSGYRSAIRRPTAPTVVQPSTANTPEASCRVQRPALGQNRPIRTPPDLGEPGPSEPGGSPRGREALARYGPEVSQITPAAGTVCPAWVTGAAP